MLQNIEKYDDFHHPKRTADTLWGRSQVLAVNIPYMDPMGICIYIVLYSGYLLGVSSPFKGLQQGGEKKTAG